jgi:hypothetical protein
MKTVFKVGDKVFHICYGWGEVIKVDSDKKFGLTIMFNYKDVESEEYFSLDGKEFEFDLKSILSFTEYTLQGFSQERPIILPEVGELCLVRDFKDSVWKARNFKKFTTHFLDGNGERWDYFKRIKILD